MEVKTFFQKNLDSRISLLYNANCSCISSFHKKIVDINNIEKKYSDISFFCFDENKVNGVVNIWKQVEVNNFTFLLEERKNYLTALTKLNKGWISGKSEIPNAFVIHLGHDILNNFRQYFDIKHKNNNFINIPKLVMGPIPTGGLCLEFHIDRENALYISMHNNKNIELDIKQFDYYSTIELNKKNVTSGVLEKYGLLTQSRNS